jgi:hypothetical protein
MMYPTVFLKPVVLSEGTVRKLYVSFCVLAGRPFGYRIDRHAIISLPASRMNCSVLSMLVLPCAG